MNAIIKRMMLAICLASMTAVASAQTYSNRIGLGVGALYERGFDATLSVEHETKNHNAWEYFINGYVKYDKDTNAGHITNDSFWKNYRTWGVGVAYKLCVFRGKNNYGALRIGGSAGSDTHEFMGWVNAGYEHNFVLHHGIKLYVQAKTDLSINGLDLFRTGVSIGVKFPVGKR